MNDWRPRALHEVDVTGLHLGPEEARVLACLDGATAVAHLPALTGLRADQVDDALERLLTLGVVEAPAQRVEEPLPSPPEGEGPQPSAEQAAEDDAESDAERGPSRVFRQLFETELHGLSADERTRLACTAPEPQLSALCFDPLPQVVTALLDNPRFGPAQARLVARHHQSAVGLEALCARAAFAADPGVRRWLVRNPHLPVALFRRLYAGRRLLDQYKLSQDRDVPEGARRTARELMRSRFASGPSEERVEVILNTEGRALAALSGLPVDARTASLLCARPYHSAMLVQNIARWSAAPPALIGHLLRQEIVRRQAPLRTLLLRHPNVPAHARRSG